MYNFYTKSSTAKSLPEQTNQVYETALYYIPVDFCYQPKAGKQAEQQGDSRIIIAAFINLPAVYPLQAWQAGVIVFLGLPNPYEYILYIKYKPVIKQIITCNVIYY